MSRHEKGSRALRLLHPKFEDWAADLAALPEAQQGDFIRATLRHKANLHIFGRYFFPHIVWSSDVEPAHLDLIEFLSGPETGAAIFPRGHGKAQPLDSRVLTPSGWKAIGELKVGDRIIGGDGRHTTVTALHPVSEMEIFEVTTADGRRTRCNDEHLWNVICPSNTGMKAITVPLKEMLPRFSTPRLDKRDGITRDEFRYFLPQVGPVRFRERKLPIDPYTFGVWLGDGDTSSGTLTCMDSDADFYATRLVCKMKKRATKYRHTLIGMTTKLRSAGVLFAKHVPEAYLFGSVDQRLELLRGLLDTDGGLQAGGKIAEFTNKNPNLIAAVVHLVRSLGGIARVGRKVNRQFGRDLFYGVVTIRLPKEINPFALPRKAEKWNGSRSLRNAITSIRQVGRAPARCITVSNGDGLYVTDDFIVTHNSSWEKVDTLHDVAYALEPVIVFVSNSFQDAQFHFESIKGELESNELLRRVYGSLVPDVGRPGVKWTNVHFETANGVNVVARGAGKGRGVNIRNRRPTKIIVDDAEDDEMVHSTPRRAKFWRWLVEVMLPSMDKERGRLKMIGTVIHPEAAVLRFWRGWGGIFRQAIEEERTIWSRYTVRDHERMRDGYVDDDGHRVEGIGHRAWMQEYQNECINDETSVFKQRWLDDNVWERLPLDGAGGHEWLDIVMVVDPAAGLSAMADFYGLVVMGIDRRDRQRYVLDADHFKGKIGDALTWAAAKFDKWKPRVWGIESVLNMTAFGQLAQDARRPDGSSYPVLLMDPEGKDKVNRAQVISPLVETGMVKFHHKHTLLYDEMVAFPNAAHDDMVDAFIYCCFLLNGSGARLDGKKSPMLTSGLRKKQF